MAAAAAEPTEREQPRERFPEWVAERPGVEVHSQGKASVILWAESAFSVPERFRLEGWELSAVNASGGRAFIVCDREASR